MIIPTNLGNSALGSRTKQTARFHGLGVSVMAGSGSAFVDGCMGGPICANSSGGIYGPGLGADASTPASSKAGLYGILASAIVVGGLLMLINKKA